MPAPRASAAPRASEAPPASAAPLSIDERLARLRERVRRTWGFPELRPMQERAMRAALEGRDALVVLPTGGGKSLCYQAPALERGGLTLVVSPLIALMKDQIDGLVANGVAAAMLSSAQDEDERRKVLGRLDARSLDLLFVAPERLVLDGFLARLERAGLAAVAVDEAHCISHWGHDFRPEYRQLGEVRRAGLDVPITACTATATPSVREDIVRQLGLRDPEILVGDFDRPNLSYRALPRGDLPRQILEVAARHPGAAGIVYCARRRDTERLARALATGGLRCLPYHAGLEADERRRVQDGFRDETVDVVVATVAFGMGIDRPDVRFVVHAALPKGIEQYSQETGRAGRDGLPAECVLFHGPGDHQNWRALVERSFAESGGGDPEELEASLERLEEMRLFASAPSCRHRALVEHFGQAWRGGSCGACDVCLGEVELLEDAAVVAQKVLSCVVHCGQRFGAAHLADVLRGARSARIERLGHDRVSTHGLLARHSGPEVRAWIDQLTALGHLASSGGEYPTLRLTRSGLEVMRAEREVQLHRPRRVPRPAGRRAAGPDLAAPELGGREPDPRLFEALRRLRRDLARERGVPPYVLFNDRTLVQMAAFQPRTPGAFLALKGVGEKKAADLGPIFLGAIERHLEEDAAHSPPPEPEP